jgi:hypothetical protein
MKNSYDHNVTLYKCRRCNSPLEIESNSFYWFCGLDDANFWCPACEDLPQAEIVGHPAENLPIDLVLPKGFTLKIMPLLEPHEVDNGNILYRPYSKRSFLRQYIEWIILSGGSPCSLLSDITVSPSFDTAKQVYTSSLDYRIYDSCNCSDCQFLQSKTVKPEDIKCSIIRMLCDTKSNYGLCQTGDEAMILQHYLMLTGAEHFPMLIPQVSILKGKRRPDFLCFVPLSRFQYCKIVILIDRFGKLKANIDTENNEYQKEGYIVKRISIDPQDYNKSYFKIARELSLWIQKIKTNNALEGKGGLS